MVHRGRAGGVGAVLVVATAALMPACSFHSGDLWPEDDGPPIEVTTSPQVVPIAGSSDLGPRWNPGLAFDAARGTVVLYDGGGFYGETRGDMWELDGNTWSLICDPCPPGPRRAPVFAYDSIRQRLVLFGGSTTTDESGAVGAMWTYDTSGWKAHPDGPSARLGSAYAFDPSRDALLVYGGITPDHRTLDELWELHGDGWFQTAARGSGPAARAFAGGTYVDAAKAFKIYGGSHDGYSGGFDDVWSWNGTDWSRVCDPCTGAPRWKGALVTVTGGTVLQIGGWNGADEFAGTRYLTGGVFKPLIDAPTARDSMGVAFDPIGSRVILVGGNGDGCNGDCSDVLQLTFH